MKTTDHFWQQRVVYPDRVRIPFDRIQAIVAEPLREEVESSGRIRRWGIAPEVGGRIVRVVLLADGETVHTAFVDGRFRP
ncbi:MAG: hypothetical protein OXN86_07710 [Chloroflexota bacterium]|nr:hypothetical protein [Chloroflexota bacterium]